MTELRQRSARWLAGLALLASVAGAEDRPLTGEPVDEGTTSTARLGITDLSNAAVVARDLHCWVDDERTKVRLYGPVGPTPATSTAITLPPEANRIVSESSDLETKVLTCIARLPQGCPAPTPAAACQPKVGGMRWQVRNNRVVVGGTTPGPSPAPTPTS